MCVCVCVCVYIYIYVCVYIYIYIYIYSSVKYKSILYVSTSLCILVCLYNSLMNMLSHLLHCLNLKTLYMYGSI